LARCNARKIHSFSYLSLDDEDKVLFSTGYKIISVNFAFAVNHDIGHKLVGIGEIADPNTSEINMPVFVQLLFCSLLFLLLNSLIFPFWLIILFFPP
jgi:hypothetical protein